jgi:hypothetical protein
MTNCGGVTCSSSVDKTVAAWSLKGAKAIHVWPDDRTDDMAVQFTYKATGDCSVDGGTYTANLSSIPSAAPKCIMVTGFAIPKKHQARIDLHLEFRWKESANWAASPDPKLYFYSGFAFKSTSTANFPNVAPSVRISMQSAGLVAAGQRVTAAGGFIFDPAGNPAADYHVRLFNLPGDASAANACAAVNSKVVADTKVSADGFWFVWKNGFDQMNTAAPPLPSKIQYSMVVCSPGTTPSSVAMPPVRSKVCGLGGSIYALRPRWPPFSVPPGPRTSRTRRRSTSGAKGFCRNAVPGSSRRAAGVRPPAFGAGYRREWRPRCARAHRASSNPSSPSGRRPAGGPAQSPRRKPP